MGAFPRGHVGAWDLPIWDLADEYAPAQLDADPFAQPFADANPAPPVPTIEFCQRCRWGLEPDGKCLRCDVGCQRCGGILDADLFCSLCGLVTTHPKREDREAA